MEFEGRARISSELNIAPLIDVVFILLIFFMLTSTMITQQAIELKLPEASSGSAIDPGQLEVSIQPNGLIFLSDKEVTLATLPDALRKATKTASDPSVVLRADSEVSTANLIAVMDIIRLQGLTRVSLATTPKVQ